MQIQAAMVAVANISAKSAREGVDFKDFSTPFLLFGGGDIL